MATHRRGIRTECLVIFMQACFHDVLWWAWRSGGHRRRRALRPCLCFHDVLFMVGGRTRQRGDRRGGEDVWGNRTDFWIAAHALVSPEHNTHTLLFLAAAGVRLHTPGSGPGGLSSVRRCEVEERGVAALRRSRFYPGLGRRNVGTVWSARPAALPARCLLPPLCRCSLLCRSESWAG